MSIQSYVVEAQTICTADAQMCPDGSYVGRTGPNCQFICPNTPSHVIPPDTLCPNIFTTLRFGHRNIQVQELQKYLFTKYNVSTQATGYFGLATRTYVIRFQKENGLQADGIVGLKTQTTIKRLCGDTTPIVTTPPASCKVWFNGCNTCSRTSANSPWACTMMACIWANEAAATCQQSF